MSFSNATEGKIFAPGYFLSSEKCERFTRQMTESLANEDKVVPMGTVYPANDGTAEGIVYEDIDVSTGDMPGSVVTKGTVYTNRLPVELNSAAQSALEAKGFQFLEEPEIVRPE